MARSFVARRPWLCAALALLLTGCDSSTGDAPDRELQQRLTGTWLRDFEEDGIRVRRVMVLESDGRFREMTRITDAAGTVTQHNHGGEWHFDGTNLKRRYTSVDGKLPSAPTMPYATFEVSFQSRNEFIGIDHVRKREVRYQRVTDEAQP